jgi:hypothetical protein
MIKDFQENSIIHLLKEDTNFLSNFCNDQIDLTLSIPTLASSKRLENVQYDGTDKCIITLGVYLHALKLYPCAPR